MLTIILIPLGIALLYGAWLAFLFFNQRRMQYFPTHRDASAKGDSVFKPWLSESGTFLGYFRPVEGPKRALIFFHGNAGEALDRTWIAELASEDDYLVVLPEYPGYGARKGSPTEVAIYQAAQEAVSEVSRRWNIPITVLGESMGTAPACFVASRQNPSMEKVDRLGLIAPFTSATDIAARAYPYAPVRLLHRDRMDASSFASVSAIPLHVIHGTLDEVIPIDLGRTLFNTYTGKPKDITEIPGYGHSNINLAVVDSPFADSFRAFLRGE